MESEQIQRLEARLSAVERRFKLVLIGGALSTALALVIGIAAVRGESQPAALVARSLDLVDNAGQPRLSLAVSTAGTPQIDFHDAQRRLRMTLGVAAAGTPYVELMDPADTVRLAMSETNAEGDPIIAFGDAQKHARLTLEMDSDGSAHVRAFNAAGVRILSAP